MSTSSKKTKLRKHAVVVEIGNDWIKLIQFEATGAGPVITRLHLEKFAELGSDVSRSIAAAVKQHKFAEIPVIACLSRQMVNIRMLELPSTDPAEIADMVDLQSGKQTPYSKEEVLCDHRIIGSVRPGYTKVMLVIVQRSLLRQQYAVLRDAGPKIERMTVTTEGLINWAGRQLAGGGAGILLDIDSVYSDFSVMSDGGVIFTRSIMVGANELLQDFDKCKERLVKEVKRSMDICEAESGGIKPDRLVISGARVGQVAEAFTGQVDVPASSVGSTAVLAKPPSGLEADAYRPVSLTALIGVALEPDRLVFNLIPDVARMRRDLELKSKRLSAFVTLVMAAMVSASLFAMTKYFLQRNRLNTVRAEYEAIRPTVREVEKMQEIIRVVRERRNPAASPLNILAEIHKQVSGDLYFDVVDIDCEGAKVSMAGMAAVSSDIGALVRNLETSSLFENVREPGTRNRDPRTNRYKFEIACSLEKQQP